MLTSTPQEAKRSSSASVLAVFAFGVVSSPLCTEKLDCLRLGDCSLLYRPLVPRRKLPEPAAPLDLK